MLIHIHIVSPISDAYYFKISTTTLRFSVYLVRTEWILSGLSDRIACVHTIYIIVIILYIY